MKIHEYQAAEIFRKAGIPTPEGEVATDPKQALAFARRAGFPVVLKAQVLVGGRGKAGGVKLVKDGRELEEKFRQVQSLSIKGYPVEKIFVVKAIDIKEEFYLAVTVDSIEGDVVLIASASGGVDIEETARTDPQAIKKLYLRGETTTDPQHLIPFVQSVFADKHHQAQAVDVIQKLVQLFFASDCSLAEINPLVIDGAGRLIAADAKINFDDNGLMRHKELAALRDMDYEEPDELEGSVGCIVNGAGLAMATMDIVKLSGGEPANFLDVGGSSSPEKVLNALKIILRNKDIKAVLINIFGGITRCDDIARGIVEARRHIAGMPSLVVRLIGTNEDQAKKILQEEGINTYPTMREAVNEVVKLSR
jgi:succinyl-CoA synthetase beta subunit